MAGKKLKSIIGVFLALTLTFTATFAGLNFTNVNGVYASSLEESEARKAELEQKNEELSAQLAQAKQNTSDAANLNQAYQEKVNAVVEQINNTTNSINELTFAIGEKTETINERQNEIDKEMETLKARIRVIYMTGDTTTLDILLSATDINDFLDKAELISTLSAHDQKLIDNINSSIIKLQEEQVQLQQEQAMLEEANNELQPQKDELEQLLKESGIQLNNAQVTETGISSDISGNEAEISALSADIAAYYASQQEQIQAQIDEARDSAGGDDNGGGSYDDGGGDSPSYSSGYTWPCPGYYYITSPFGDMDGRSTPHTGVDISGSGIYGAPIVAADSGMVDYSWYASDGYGGGYGNYCMIDHDGGRSTLYGHMCQIIVSPGQYVQQGQVIGYVGSTGYSTGPHLHFECRQNGVPYDPMSEF